MIMDMRKNNTLGKFKSKCREVGCHTKQTDYLTPRSNSYDVAINEVKLASGRGSQKNKCSKQLWDNYIERHAYIKSFTSHDIFALKGDTPDTLVNSETLEIREFATFKWYAWIKYRDQQIAFPDNNLGLKRYLGPSFDIGP